jgi:hypothetical protein
MRSKEAEKQTAVVRSEYERSILELGLVRRQEKRRNKVPELVNAFFILAQKVLQ